MSAEAGVTSIVSGEWGADERAAGSAPRSDALATSAWSTGVGSGCATGAPSRSSVASTSSSDGARTIRKPYRAASPGCSVRPLGGFHGDAARHAARAYALECSTSSYDASYMKSSRMLSSPWRSGRHASNSVPDRGRRRRTGPTPVARVTWT